MRKSLEFDVKLRDRATQAANRARAAVGGLSKEMTRLKQVGEAVSRSLEQNFNALSQRISNVESALQSSKAAIGGGAGTPPTPPRHPTPPKYPYGGEAPGGGYGPIGNRVIEAKRSPIDTGAGRVERLRAQADLSPHIQGRAKKKKGVFSRVLHPITSAMTKPQRAAEAIEGKLLSSAAGYAGVQQMRRAMTSITTGRGISYGDLRKWYAGMERASEATGALQSEIQDLYPQLLEMGEIGPGNLPQYVSTMYDIHRATGLSLDSTAAFYKEVSRSSRIAGPKNLVSVFNDITKAADQSVASVQDITGAVQAATGMAASMRSEEARKRYLEGTAQTAAAMENKGLSANTGNDMMQQVIGNLKSAAFISSMSGIDVMDMTRYAPEKRQAIMMEAVRKAGMASMRPFGGAENVQYNAMAQAGYMSGPGSLMPLSIPEMAKLQYNSATNNPNGPASVLAATGQMQKTMTPTIEQRASSSKVNDATYQLERMAATSEQVLTKTGAEVEHVGRTAVTGLSDLFDKTRQVIDKIDERTKLYTGVGYLGGAQLAGGAAKAVTGSRVVGGVVGAGAVVGAYKGKVGLLGGGGVPEGAYKGAGASKIPTLTGGAAALGAAAQTRKDEIGISGASGVKEGTYTSTEAPAAPVFVGKPYSRTYKEPNIVYQRPTQGEEETRGFIKPENIAVRQYSERISLRENRKREEAPIAPAVTTLSSAKIKGSKLPHEDLMGAIEPGKTNSYDKLIANKNILLQGANLSSPGFRAASNLGMFGLARRGKSIGKSIGEAASTKSGRTRMSFLSSIPGVREIAGPLQAAGMIGGALKASREEREERRKTEGIVRREPDETKAYNKLQSFTKSNKALKEILGKLGNIPIIGKLATATNIGRDISSHFIGENLRKKAKQEMIDLPKKQRKEVIHGTISLGLNKGKLERYKNRYKRMHLETLLPSVLSTLRSRSDLGSVTKISSEEDFGRLLLREPSSEESQYFKVHGYYPAVKIGEEAISSRVFGDHAYVGIKDFMRGRIQATEIIHRKFRPESATVVNKRILNYGGFSTKGKIAPSNIVFGAYKDPTAINLQSAAAEHMGWKRSKQKTVSEIKPDALSKHPQLKQDKLTKNPVGKDGDVEKAVREGITVNKSQNIQLEAINNTLNNIHQTLASAAPNGRLPIDVGDIDIGG